MDKLVLGKVLTTKKQAHALQESNPGNKPSGPLLLSQARSLKGSVALANHLQAHFFITMTQLNPTTELQLDYQV